MNHRSHSAGSRRFLSAVLVATALCVGCTASVDVSDAPEPMSAEDFQAEGNRICRSLVADLDEIRENGTDDSGSLTREARSQMTNVRAAAFATLLQLQPPPESEEDLAELKAIREEWVATANARIPEPDVDLRLGPQWDAVAARLNLNDCT